MSLKFTILSALVFAVGVSAPQLYAEEDPEAKEAADEEEARRKKELATDRPVFEYIVGTLELKPKAQRGEGKGVIGVLKAKGKDYQVKLQSPFFMEQFEKFDGKAARLMGNPQNKGKYFVASSVSTPPPTPTNK